MLTHSSQSFEPKFEFISKIAKYSSTAVRIAKICTSNRMTVHTINNKFDEC